MKTIFSFLFFISGIVLYAQPVPKYDFGLSGGMIIQSRTGSDRAIGGEYGLLSNILDFSTKFYKETVVSVGLDRSQTNYLQTSNSVSTKALASIGTMVDENWQICGSFGKYFGSSSSTFLSVFNFAPIRTINGKDTTIFQPPSQYPIGTTESKIVGWILEFGARYHFGTDIHPFVGAGFRYNTQSVSATTMIINNVSVATLLQRNIEELGAYLGGGVKVPLSKVFCLDIQADALFRNAKNGNIDKEKEYETAWAIEPAIRVGVSFDLNSILDIGKHPGDYDDDPKPKSKPKTPKAPGPSDK